MDVFEVEAALNTMVICVDTREQDTLLARKRYKQFGTPYERVYVPFGDYSAYCTLPNGERLSLFGEVHIERKSGLAELSMNFFQGRDRFEREFERAKQAGAKMYLLVENGSVDKIYDGDFGTKANKKSYVAKFFTWLARYNCQIVFCEANKSGYVIHDILYRELKERLKEMVEDA